MKILRVVLPIVLAGAVVLVAVAKLSRQAEAEAFRVQREALRREMLDRSLVARGVGGPAGMEEARAAVRWWTEAVSALRSRFPRQDPAPAQPRAGAADEAWFRYARERLDGLAAGYAPVLGAVEQGVRLDVVAIRAGEHPETHGRGVRIDFALWGAPRRLERDPAAPEGARAPQRVVVPVAFRQLTLRFVDADGKPYGEMTGSGEPYLFLKDPERFDPALPPGIALGTWWVEPFPREAARVELAVAVQVQGLTAATLTPAFRWEVPIAEEWKLPPGEAFRGEPREAPPAPAGERR